jgi:hypothetical protein
MFYHLYGQTTRVSRGIPEGVVEEDKLESNNKTWKLDRSTRALTAPSTRKCPPRHERHCRCTNPPSSPLLASLLYAYTGKMMILDTSQTPRWQKLIYWTAFCNTLFYLLTHDSTTVRLQHLIALALGCYSYAYALFDEAREQQSVSFTSMIISTIALGHMVWMYRQRRRTQ